MVPTPGTPLRTDRLRVLNVPQKSEALDLLDVEAVVEEWRIEDEWWRLPISRRYFEVVLRGGKHVVLYQDRLTGEWFVQMP